MQEIHLFIVLYGMHPDDPLRRQLISQCDITFLEVECAFLCMDQDQKHSAAMESANAVTVSHCYICRLPHIAKYCPHMAVIDCLISDHSKGKDKHKNKLGQVSNSTTPTPLMNTNTTTLNTMNTLNATLAPSVSTSAHVAKAAGVATSFLCSTSHTDWLCDSGATSTMSADHSTFLILTPERHVIQIANGNVIYSEGLGPIHFLSSLGFYITINDVLFEPFCVELVHLRAS